jgi:hypothetical protein
MMNQAAFCTIFTKNHLAHVRTLHDSLRQHHGKEPPFFALLIDKSDGFFNPKDEPFHIIELDELRIPQLSDLLFAYNASELCTALKPSWLIFLLKTCQVRKLIYLDSDIEVHQPLHPLLKILDSHPMAITPHSLNTSATDLPSESEINLLHNGAFNLGFLGVAEHEASMRFLHWWNSKLMSLGYAMQYAGLFVDQKWVDQAVARCEGFFVVRDPNCNVAYWNVSERPMNTDGEGENFTVSGLPLLFFHFSGFDYANDVQLSRYSDLYVTPADPVYKIMSRYASRLKSNGVTDIHKWPYTYDYSESGEKIMTWMRRYYSMLRACREIEVDNPFSDKVITFLKESVGANMHPQDAAEESSKTFQKEYEQFFVRLKSVDWQKTNADQLKKLMAEASRVIVRASTLLHPLEEEVSRLRGVIRLLKNEINVSNSKLQRVRKIPGYLSVSRILKRFGF